MVTVNGFLGFSGSQQVIVDFPKCLHLALLSHIVPQWIQGAKSFVESLGDVDDVGEIKVNTAMLCLKK